MGRTSRPERHSQHLPDTPPDSNLSRSPSAATQEISGDNYINQPPKTYCPPGRRVEQSHDSLSQQHESRSSRIKPRVYDRTSYCCRGTYWDDSIGRPVFKEHHNRQSERLPGCGDRIFFTVGIDTQQHFRRASLTLPKPLGKPCFLSSQTPRIAQDCSQQKSSGRCSRPQGSRAESYNRDIHPKHSREPRERTSEGRKKSSTRDQENCVRPKLTEENVILNARRASPSNCPDVQNVPTRPPFSAQATTRQTKASWLEKISRDPPAS